MMENTKSGRNNCIELLRFLFAVSIVFYHGRGLARGVPSVFTDRHLFQNGALAVEFFSHRKMK